MNLAAVLIILAFIASTFVGFAAGRKSVERQMVRCEQKNTSNEPGIYICLPVNQ